MVVTSMSKITFKLILFKKLDWIKLSNLENSEREIFTSSVITMDVSYRADLQFI